MRAKLTLIIVGFSRWRGASLLLLCGLLSACSTTSLVYNRLDFIARWEAGKYVSMTDAQKAQFDAQFQTFWGWHRREELPRWVAELRGMADALDQPLSREALGRTAEHYGEAWDRIMAHLVPLACALGPGLSADQVDELLAEADEDIAELVREQIEPPPDEVLHDTERELDKALRRWFGSLDDAQRGVIAEWNRARPSVAPAWVAYRRSWREALGETLQQRQTPAFCPEMTTLLTEGSSLWTPDQQAIFAENQVQWLNLFERLLPSLSPKQREHAQRRLRDLADAFAALAVEPR
ncbi:hypothetical protein E4T66_12390 [Sinimarinibacterium sp. CAU 1509]|uniref:DUF6279 family lipoprotein n=1 Tax=Sinimarinibacterium sp. CAU 1509 TaxID=2562283 RepID=UPI0010AD2C4C|nr:DUF6279 family lipoprotein [Sinimarinibacterium sp. CAU 1509]TJY59974.1 hypothetical protein E4T66_12390 [Sinimarinibacterium sp. CAU 1509]